MDVLGVRSLPFLSRRNYYYELKHLLFWSALAGLVEGQFASIIVAKTFDGGKLLITIATATPAASLIFSLFWGMLCVGRPKVRLLTFFASGTVLVTGLIGLIPPTATGAVLFLVQMAAAQILLAGVVTVRTALWKSNYPHVVRGRITARLHAVRFVVSIMTVLIAARMCDRDPTSYRYIFPIAAAVGAISILIAQRIRIRGEESELRRRPLQGRAIDLQADPVERLSLAAVFSPGRVFGRMVEVFRRDRRFARYCIAQAFTGVANFMTIPVVVAIVTQVLDLGFAWGFWISAALIQVIPQLFRLGSLHRWARLFDRVGVVRLRVLNVACWLAAMVFGLLATLVVVGAERNSPICLPIAVALFALRGLGSGLALGGGALAWNLGHLHFARSEEAEVYMGIHVFLTGVRGLIGPAIGMVLWSFVGWWVWVGAIALTLCSLHMYRAMAREEALATSASAEAG